MAYERVTLYGVPLVADRRVNYGAIDRELARELFIRHALVEGEWHDPAPVLRRRTARCSSEVEELEHRARRRDIVVDDETLFDFYDARMPADVVSGAPLRPVVEAGRGRDAARPARPSTRRCCSPSGRPRTAGDGLPGHVAGRATSGCRWPTSSSRAPTDDGVTVASRSPVLNQVARRRLRLAGPGPARGAGHRADPLAAEAAPAARSCRRPTYAAPVLASGRPADGAAGRGRRPGADRARRPAGTAADFDPTGCRTT